MDECITFEVEVEAGVEPIRGLIRLGERELSFDGWVGLAGALEQILGTSSTAT